MLAVRSNLRSNPEDAKPGRQELRTSIKGMYGSTRRGATHRPLRSITRTHPSSDVTQTAAPSGDQLWRGLEKASDSARGQPMQASGASSSLEAGNRTYPTLSRVLRLARR